MIGVRKVFGIIVDESDFLINFVPLTKHNMVIIKNKPRGIQNKDPDIYRSKNEYKAKKYPKHAIDRESDMA